jgi:hypothetical protein
VQSHAARTSSFLSSALQQQQQQQQSHASNSHALLMTLSSSCRSVVETKDATVIIEETRTCTVNMRASHWRYWDLLLLMCVGVTALFQPFEVAFLSYDDKFTFAVNRVIDIVFAVDTILQFFIPYEDEDGNTVTDNGMIAWNYLKGMFLVDLVAIIPYDLLADSNTDFVNKLSLLRVLRLLRLIKLLRIIRASRVANRWRNRLGASNAISSLLRFLVMFLLVLHWSACLWFLAAKATADANQGSLEHTWVGHAGLDQETTASKYLASIYYACTTATTVGYGDIRATTDVERGVSLVVMLMGGGLYAFMVGSVQTILSSMDEAKQQFDADSDNLNLFMASVRLPHNLRVDIREFFDQTLQVHRERYYRDILRKLSPMLRKRVAAHCHMTWVTAVPFFSCSDPEELSEFAASIAVRLRTEAFAPLEFILRPGYINRRLFIIQRGLAVRRSGGRVIGAGAWFGEEMILTRGRVLHEGVSSITLLMCMTLHRDDLAAVLDSGHFEKTRKSLRRAVVRLALRQEFVRCARLAQLHTQTTRIKSKMRAIGRLSVAGKVGGSHTPFSPTVVANNSDDSPRQKRHGRRSSRYGGGGDNREDSKTTGATLGSDLAAPVRASFLAAFKPKAGEEDDRTKDPEQADASQGEHRHGMRHRLSGSEEEGSEDTDSVAPRPGLGTRQPTLRMPASRPPAKHLSSGASHDVTDDDSKQVFTPPTTSDKVTMLQPFLDTAPHHVAPDQLLDVDDSDIQADESLQPTVTTTVVQILQDDSLPRHHPTPTASHHKLRATQSFHASDLSQMRQGLDETRAPLLARVMARAAVVADGDDRTGPEPLSARASRALGIPDAAEMRKQQAAAKSRRRLVQRAQRELGGLLVEEASQATSEPSTRRTRAFSVTAGGMVESAPQVRGRHLDDSDDDRSAKPDRPFRARRQSSQTKVLATSKTLSLDDLQSVALAAAAGMVGVLRIQTSNPVGSAPTSALGELLVPKRSVVEAFMDGKAPIQSAAELGSPMNMLRFMDAIRDQERRNNPAGIGSQDGASEGGLSSTGDSPSAGSGRGKPKTQSHRGGGGYGIGMESGRLDQYGPLSKAFKQALATQDQSKHPAAESPSGESVEDVTDKTPKATQRRARRRSLGYQASTPSNAIINSFKKGGVTPEEVDHSTIKAMESLGAKPTNLSQFMLAAQSEAVPQAMFNNSSAEVEEGGPSVADGSVGGAALSASSEHTESSHPVVVKTQQPSVPVVSVAEWNQFGHGILRAVTEAEAARTAIEDMTSRQTALYREMEQMRTALQSVTASLAIRDDQLKALLMATRADRGSDPQQQVSLWQRRALWAIVATVAVSVIAIVTILLVVLLPTGRVE